MSEDTTIYTATMAKIYAGQGHFHKAAKIFRYLLDRSPGDEDLRSALEAVEEKLAENRQSRSDRLEHLLRQWITLMNAYNARHKLTEFTRRMA